PGARSSTRRGSGLASAAAPRPAPASGPVRRAVPEAHGSAGRTRSLRSAERRLHHVLLAGEVVVNRGRACPARLADVGDPDLVQATPRDQPPGRLQDLGTPRRPAIRRTAAARPPVVRGRAGAV